MVLKTINNPNSRFVFRKKLSFLKTNHSFKLSKTKNDRLKKFVDEIEFSDNYVEWMLS